MSKCLRETAIEGVSCRRGKVRDIYDFGDFLLLVSTDRISAFDWVLPTPIPDKGKVLNLLSAFWFRKIGEKNHLVSTNVFEIPLPPSVDRAILDGRVSWVKKTKVIPIECVVRGYLSGSGWVEYQRNGMVCGVKLPPGLRESDHLPEPIFTPATKAETGHDENITFDRMVEIIGGPLAEELRAKSLQVYKLGASYAAERGIIVADTKFEWGMLGEEVLLIDELLTPDSSRFWPADSFQPGKSQPSFDKQFVRDWLTQSGWDKNSPPPPLPEDVVLKTREKYVEAFVRLTGEPFPGSAS